jgi:SAM-dependent MidA family methyltransferase
MTFIDYFYQRWLEYGAMPFVMFMQEALYAPNLGYYNSGARILGSSGDFITAPELTPLFGHTLALQCQQVLSQFDTPVLFEFGAGSGRLCIDILQQLQQLEALPDTYYILEVSGHLKARQQALIAKEAPELLGRVKWLTQWPDKPFNGVVIANEVLDAMPVHRFLQTEAGLFESYVGFNHDQQLEESFKPCDNERLSAYVNQALPALSSPYLSEVNLFLDDWLKQCYSMLDKGAVFLIDYGFPRHEYYHPDRNQGTLMCHHQHLAHTNCLAYPGEQDITAHVDFTHVAEAAYAAGFHVAGFTNQAAFLLSNGLLELAQKHHHLATQNQLKQLIQPSEMGELFKVIGLTKQFDEFLQGFQLQDKRASL